jgi:uncharacterized beta-barrel protein YwiB (DUF1934 family)
MSDDIKKNMLLTFSSTIEDMQEEKDKIEFVTLAELTMKNNKYYITFDELQNLQDTEKTKTTLKIEDDKVTLLRYGFNSTQFIFEQGKKHNGHYETPYGAFTVGVFSDNLSVNINENGGDLSVSYGIYFNDLISHHSKISINLKETN